MKQKKRAKWIRTQRLPLLFTKIVSISIYPLKVPFFAMFTGCCYQLNWPCRHHRLNLFLLCWFIFSCFSFWISLFCLSIFKSPISATKCAENAIFPSFYLLFSCLKVMEFSVSFNFYDMWIVGISIASLSKQFALHLKLGVQGGTADLPLYGRHIRNFFRFADCN